MKRVLITGANSYVGTNVEKWLMKEPENFYVETLDMRDPNWKHFDFSKFDVVVHVAGIAHIKETNKNRYLYFKVNRDLAVETAIKAKESGVEHFIFLSSMSVYGKVTGTINAETIPKPKDAYGKSKLEAERLISEIQNDAFKVLVLRPPMIYGANSPGNFQKLSKVAKIIPIFPSVKNYRSMLFIGNLARFIEFYITNKSIGVRFPQNEKYVSTTHLIELIRRNHNMKMRKSIVLGSVVKCALSLSISLKKIYGNLTYSSEIDKIDLIEFEETIKLTEISFDKKEIQ
ncbi:NAD-dependent epimerase/dehydratase family protein [Paracholeplasma manati]|uniref:NAD-dependent epimerase/dehydratase family protein n=1 Tax=Paracholeplasma manati TaxID=591373 RepID=UPI002407F2F3|nr:NAD-dependent epimerase/dehydratase family protein [Paracholeplasma manati]MDG0888947.1 NAD-dependent epimerase/dehydratase family protein [Paracholeplasma manati]